MLEKTKTEFILDLKDTEIIFNRENLSGISTFKYKGDTLIGSVSSYADDRKDSMAVVRHSKGSNKSGVDTVEMEGYLPIGSEIHFRHKYQFRQNHGRVSTDIKLHAGTSINRHFGVCSLFLPGKWAKFYCLPAPQHLIEGAKAEWKAIDYGRMEEGKLMIGHWHRPPQSLVFVRENGVKLEVATGYDLWRWENGMNYAPESGSYKLHLSEEGLHVVREPLMCCENFTPESRQYRYTWNLAWGEGKNEAPAVVEWFDPIGDKLPSAGTEVVGIDFALADWTESFYKVESAEAQAKGAHSGHACFSHHKVEAAIRKYIRRLRDVKGVKTVYFRNLNTGYCVNQSHVGRKGEKTLLHNDTNYILDFIDWSAQALRETAEVKLWRDDDQPTMLAYK